jgi:hypothetical protein
LNLAGCPGIPGEHEVHPYIKSQTLCRGEYKDLTEPLLKRINSVIAFFNKNFSEGISNEIICLSP